MEENKRLPLALARYLIVRARKLVLICFAVQNGFRRPLAQRYLPQDRQALH